MEVKLVSEDRELYRLCQDILAEDPARDWRISAILPQDLYETPIYESSTGDNGADFYLWDYDPRMRLPAARPGSTGRHLFLVNRRDLPVFQERAGSLEAPILLKPATRATLTAFLGLASEPEDRNPAVQHLRADRDEILQCLIQTNLRLQEYDQDRTTFLARAVHDFRAPLTAVSGYCGLLLAEPLGPLAENQREILRRMQHSARRLSRMAAAMFELSVGRHMKRRCDLQPGDLRECLEQALHEITPFADDKRIAIGCDLAPGGENLHFETGQIEQVLINILDNACKFTPKAGSIEIRGYPFFWERRKSAAPLPPAAEHRRRVSREPNAYRVDILDSGAAIPVEHLQSIFEEYTSYAGGRDRSGGGLGLAITRMIVTQHEGCVWAENTESGPMFSFVLPIHHREPAHAVERIQMTA
jgi:signal transduction histidine kinase